MFDKGYDEPNYTPGGDNYDQPKGKGPADYAGDASYYAGKAGEYAGAAGQAAKKTAKKMLPIVIILIVVVIIAGAALYFLTSNQKVTFSISELDGASLNATLEIKNGDTYVLKPKQVQGTYETTLGPGTYNYKVTAALHEPVEGTLVIPTATEEERTLSIELAKDVEATITATTPEIIYEGQEVQGTVSITNTGTTDLVQGELMVVSDTDSLIDINISNKRLDISKSGGVVTVPITLRIKTGKDITVQKDTSATVKIKGTNSQKTINIKAMPAVSSTNVKINTGTTGMLQMIDLTAGKEVTKSITIQNNDKSVPLTDVLISIVADPDYASNLDWVRFDQYFETPNQRKISQILPKITTPIIIYIKPSKDAEIDDQLLGNLIISSPSISEEIRLAVNLKVKTKSFARLTIAPTTINVSCDDALTPPCQTVSITDKVNLKNDGTVDLDTITISLDENTSETDCLNWVTISDPIISSLAKGATTKLQFDITPTVDSEKNQTRCYFAMSYHDPVENEDVTVVSEVPVIINKTVK